MPYITNAGTRIYWEEQGSGEPVLMIMGLGYSLEMWEDTRDVIATRYRAILLDNRGVGRSDVPPPPYSIATMAADAAAVMDAAGTPRAHVFGVSMGGLIAQEVALQYPERVQSLLLGCTFCGGPQAVPADADVLSTVMKVPMMDIEAGFRLLAPFIYSPATPPERIAKALELRRQHFPTMNGFMGQVFAIQQYRSCDRLGGLTASTLIIHGDSDRLVPPANAHILGERIPGATVVIIPDASHIFAADQPEKSHGVILDFLARQRPAVPATI